MSHKILKIDPQSPLQGRASVGDTLEAIGENTIADVLDYKFYAYDSRLDLKLRRGDGSTYSVLVNKGEGEDLGLEFEDYLMDAQRSCRNKCIFCFIDQLPPDMRKSLYFKDDDARLSFLTGNYITLTNIGEDELERIIKLRISPINISVHTTNPELRVKMLGNKWAFRAYDQMRRLAEGGIRMNCQIVCCPGVNDAQELMRTMQDLYALHPHVCSVSVVPVGLSRYREALARLEPFDEKRALETIELINNFGDSCLRDCGDRLFYAADELYLKARLPIPDEDYYEGYPQLENGVGMLRLFEEDFLYTLEDATPALEIKPFSIVTGTAAGDFLEKLLVTASERCGKIPGKVFTVQNDFFGHSIDVSGLVTGRDIARALRDKELGESLLIPRNMLRRGEDVFLDDMTVGELERLLDVRVSPVETDGGSLLHAIFKA